jgi:hypothetical protein
VTRYCVYFFTGVFYYYSYALLAGMASGFQTIAVVLFFALLAFPAILPPLALYQPRIAAAVAVPFLLLILWWLLRLSADNWKYVQRDWRSGLWNVFIVAPSLCVSVYVWKSLRSPPAVGRWKWEWMRPVLAVIPPLLLLLYWGWLRRWWLR